jgi:hypothetical protein
VAAGVFLTVAAGSRLRLLAVRRTSTGGAARLQAADGVAAALQLITALVGAAMVISGVYATYIVLFAQ